MAQRLFVVELFVVELFMVLPRIKGLEGFFFLRQAQDGAEIVCC
jgi:hypothetical protein